MLFSHGGALRLDVECLECELTDLGADDLGTSEVDAESSGLGAYEPVIPGDAKPNPDRAHCTAEKFALGSGRCATDPGMTVAKG